MIAKISVFVICIEETIYLLLYSLYDCIFNGKLHFFLYSVTLRKNCPCSEFFWSAFSHIWTEPGDLQSYSVRMWENADRKNSKYRHFLRSVTFLFEIKTKYNASMNTFNFQKYLEKFTSYLTEQNLKISLYYSILPLSGTLDKWDFS